MIRWIFLLTLSLSWPALACMPAADYVPISQRAPKALLYEVSGCNQPVRYIFGTYHSDSPKLAAIIEQITPHLQRSERLWVEIAHTPELLAQTQQLLLLPPEAGSLESIIGETLYQELSEKIVPLLGMPEALIQRFEPWALALLVQYPPSEADGMILDAKLQQLAARKAIGISGLESLQEQFSIFTQMPASMKIDFLRDTLAHLTEITLSIKLLEAHYLNQDIWAIASLGEEQFARSAQDYPELAQYLRRTLLEQRNRKMTENILQKMPHRAFVAVGALHLPGDDGILALLEKAGLQVNPVSK